MSVRSPHFVLIPGVPDRFRCGKQVGSYLELIPANESAHPVVRYEPAWRSQFPHLAMRRGRPIAKVAMARKLAVRLYWMWCKGRDYQHILKFGSPVG